MRCRLMRKYTKDLPHSGTVGIVAQSLSIEMYFIVTSKEAQTVDS